MLREVKKLKFLDKAMFEKGNLEVEIIWKDSDLLEIYTKASNGRYYGTTEVYTSEDNLIEFGNKLKEFPKQISDNVIFEAGDEMVMRF